MGSILEKLRKPFHPSHVTWTHGEVKPGKAVAQPVADLRAYQDRLDEVCGLGWSVAYTPWGEKIVCHLTVIVDDKSITRSSSATSEAGAFRVACAMFGLGRYLATLPSVWVEFDNERQQFTDRAKARLEGIVVAHYRRTLDAEAVTA